MLAYIRARLMELMVPSDSSVQQYADGFMHGLDAGQAICAHLLTVAELIKSAVDRGDYELAIMLLEELKQHEAEQESDS